MLHEYECGDCEYYYLLRGYCTLKGRRVEEDAPIPRDMLVEYLRERGIGSAIHYPLAVHEQPLYRTLGYGSQCPVATELSRKVLSLPVHPLLTQTELAHICDTLNDLEG